MKHRQGRAQLLLSECVEVLVGKVSLMLCYEAQIKLIESVLGAYHPRLVSLLNKLALHHASYSQFAKAATCYQRLLNIHAFANSTESIELAETYNNFATLYQLEHKYYEAEQIYARSIQLMSKLKGPHYDRLGLCYNNLALLLATQQRWPQSEQNYLKCLMLFNRLGADHYFLDTALHNIRALLKASKFEERLHQVEPTAVCLQERDLQEWLSQNLGASAESSGSDSSSRSRRTVWNFDSSLELSWKRGWLDVLLWLLMHRAFHLNYSHPQDGRNLLMLAILLGNEPAAFNLIRLGINLSHADKAGRNALDYAVKKNMPAVVEALARSVRPALPANSPDFTQEMTFSAGPAVSPLLLFKHFLSDTPQANAKSALMCAAENGHTEVAELLIQYGTNFNQQDKDGKTALMYAVSKRHFQIASLLVNHGAAVNATDAEGRSVLSWAVESGDEDIVEFLIGKGGLINSCDTQGKTVLMYAVASGKTDIACLLVQRSADVRALNKNGVPALWYAVQHGQKDAAILLITHGASVDDASGRATMIWAVKSGHRDLVQYLIQQKADVQQTDPTSGKSVLWMAVEYGHMQIAELLVQSFASLTFTCNGWSILMVAATRGDRQMAALLLQHGAAANYANPQGQTALMVAAARGRSEVMTLLIQHSAIVDHTDNEGLTALMYAAEAGQTQAVTILLRSGASVRLTDRRGLSAWHYAVQGECHSVMQILQAHDPSACVDRSVPAVSAPQVNIPSSGHIAESQSSSASYSQGHNQPHGFVVESLQQRFAMPISDDAGNKIRRSSLAI
eukprot:TRINITY_DN8069_c0_g1_i5.p1 TRINITY_DN8069_c0_g1~~TRINITY_DN8069_c0_g1_i5.p1  ORF type:complete len:794 (+),score=214.69 TRINITY_DN8069_c0_g1_i5:67-2448(+)